ncbi:MAG: hypothetical protein B6244_11200 [Candidatus Cloacimonetes bacterium 4572_55]|nr:MAG: hypothetical protein B6244_11200 [Candidatus Cloacimonetes bacterium 4572_55]
MKFNRLRDQILYPISAIVIVIFLVIITAVSFRVRTITMGLSKKSMEETTLHYAKKIESDLNHSMDAARNLAFVFESYEMISAGERREVFDDMLRNTIENHSEFLAIRSIWEPGALDANTEQSSGTKRYSTGWYWADGVITRFVSEDSEKTEHYYLVPKETGMETVMEPYLYSYNGSSENDILIISLVAPIMRQNQFIGIVGIDMELSLLQYAVADFQIFASGFGALVDNKGGVVAHPKKNYIGKNIVTLDNREIREKELEIIQQGKQWETTLVSGYGANKKEWIHTLAPVIIGESTTPWGFYTGVPTSEIFEQSDSLRNFIIFLVLVMAAPVLIGAIVFISNQIEKPIKSAVEAVREISKGNLDVNIEIDSNDEIGQLLSAMQVMVVNLRSVILSMIDTAKLITDTSLQLSENSQLIREGTVAQSSATEETSSSMEEMATSIRQISENTESLANNVNETSASIEQMTISIRSVSDNTDDLSKIVHDNASIIENMAISIEHVALNSGEAEKASKSAVNVAKEGGDIVQRATDGIQKIAKTMDEIIAMIQKLDASGKKINSIIGTIDGIAEQTNLLALNAAIEAARAGEHGRGFAVVADEVRKLAERSAGSAKKIVRLINTVQEDTEGTTRATREGANRVNEGVQLITQTGGALEKIVSKISDVSHMMSEINAATDQQSNGSEQVVVGFGRVRQMTRQINAATKEQTRGSSQIMKAIEIMNAMTRQVSISIDEQRRGGEQIVRAIENIASISEQNQDVVDRFVGIVETLNQQADGLRKLTGRFHINDYKC